VLLSPRYFGKYLKNLGFEGVFQPPAGERPIDGFLDVGKQRFLELSLSLSLTLYFSSAVLFDLGG
jgi:hypothetical protein